MPWPTRFPGQPGRWVLDLSSEVPAPGCPVHRSTLRGGFCPACHREEGAL